MTLDELKTNAMTALYGPLLTGQDKERWRRVEVDDDECDDDSNEDSEAEKDEKFKEPKFEWVGVSDVKIEHFRNEFDAFVPSSGPERVLVSDNAKWHLLSKQEPEQASKTRAETVFKLAQRAGVMLAEDYEPPEGGDEKGESTTQPVTQILEQVAHQFWEMSSDARRRGATDLGYTRNAYDAILGFLEAPDEIVTPKARLSACAAAWSLAVSVSGRTGLLKSKGFKAIDDHSEDSEGRAVVSALRELVDKANDAVAAAELIEGKVRKSEVKDEEVPVTTETTETAETTGTAETTKESSAPVAEDKPMDQEVVEGDAPAGDDTQAQETTPAESTSTETPPTVSPIQTATLSPEEQEAHSLFTHTVNTVGVLSVDKHFRAAYAKQDPSFATLIKACGDGKSSEMESSFAKLRANAANVLASSLIRDGECRKRVVKSGGFSDLVKLTADHGNPDVKLAAAETCASFAREPRVVSKVKSLDADVKVGARAMSVMLKTSLDDGVASKSSKERKVIRDTSRAVSASMAGMIRGVARRAQSAKRKAADTNDPNAFAAATKPIADSIISQMVTHCTTVSSASRSLVSEMTVASSFGVLSSLAEDREMCERAVRLGDRPKTPPPFTVEELETFQLEAFQARKEGREYTQQVRVKAEWDPSLSIIEMLSKILRKGRKGKKQKEGDAKNHTGSYKKDEGCARVAAAVVLARVLEHEKSDGVEKNEDEDEDDENNQIEHCLLGAHRKFLASENVMSALLTSAERGASDTSWRAPLAEASAAALMYLATPLQESCPRSAGDIKRLAQLAVRPVGNQSDDSTKDDDMTQTGVSAQFLATALWACARSPAGRDTLLQASPDVIANLVAAGQALVPSAELLAKSSSDVSVDTPSDASTPGSEDLSCRVTALEFIVATVWLLTYGDSDPVLEHGEVYDANEDGSCYWTVGRRRAPTLAEASVGSTGRLSSSMGNADDAIIEDLKIAAEAANDRVWKMKQIEAKGDSPPMTSKEAETQAVLAENAVLDKQREIQEKAANRAVDAQKKRLDILQFLTQVVSLPGSQVTARARITAIGAAWNACCRSPEARREVLELGFFDALEKCAADGGEAATTKCVLASYDAMETLVGSYDDVASYVGGPKRLEKVAMQLAISSDLLERERGARALAFITSSAFAHRDDANAVKTALLQVNAVGLLLQMLCPPTKPEATPMDTGEEDDSEEEYEESDDENQDGGSKHSNSSSNSGSKNPIISRNEILRATEMFAAAALLNISTLPAAQISLAKKGLYTLLKTNASVSMTERRLKAIKGGQVTGGDLIAGTIHNVAGHPKNRTRMYKLELRAKAMERVLHEGCKKGKSTRHVGGKAAHAALVVGGAHERAAAGKTTFEKVTQRRRRGGENNDDETGVVKKTLGDAPDVTLSPNVVRKTVGDAPVSPGEEDPEDAETPAAPLNDDKSESDWSNSDDEEADLANKSESSLIAQRDFPTQQRDDDWLEGMMTRYAASEAGNAGGDNKLYAKKKLSTQDTVFTDGLALLAHSMRAPLRHVWARPEVTDKVSVIGDPNWTANRGATRVSMRDPPRGAPRGDKRWHPPVREYREHGAKLYYTEDKVSPEKVSKKGYDQIVPATATRLLSTIPRTKDVDAKLETLAMDVATSVAFSAPVAFGGFGNDGSYETGGQMGSLRVPNPEVPVVRAKVNSKNEKSSDVTDVAVPVGTVPLEVPSGEKTDPTAAGDDKAEDAAVAEQPSAIISTENTNGDKENGTSVDSNTPEIPLQVVLEPCHRRHRVSFVSSMEKDDNGNNGRRSKLTLFEHTPGARAHLDAGLPPYPLPNGKRAFYYQAGGDVVCEVAVGMRKPPRRPSALFELGRESLPTTSNVLQNTSLLFFPVGYSPVSQLCPLPTEHTLNVLDSDDIQRRSAFGDLAPRPARFVLTEVLARRTEEEHAAFLMHKTAARAAEAKKQTGKGKSKKGVSFFTEPVDEIADLEELNLGGEGVSDGVKETFDPRQFSVFSGRVEKSDSKDVHDRDVVYDLMFDFDWHAFSGDPRSPGAKFLKLRLERIAQATREAGAVPPKDALLDVQMTLRAFYEEVTWAYRHFAVVDGVDMTSDDSSVDPSTTVQNSSFQLTKVAFDKFADMCQLPVPRTKCTKAHLDAIFQAVSKSEDKNESQSISRSGFLELLVRIADAKYVKSGDAQSLAAGVEMLFETDVLPILKGDKDILSDPQSFRENFLYHEDVDDVFRGALVSDKKVEGESGEKEFDSKFDEFGARVATGVPTSTRWLGLTSLFDACTSQNTGRMTLSNWLSLLQTCGIPQTSGDGGFTLTDAKRAFAFSQMRVIRADSNENDTISFLDFLEALARVASGCRVELSEDEVGVTETSEAKGDQEEKLSEDDAGAETVDPAKEHAATPPAIPDAPAAQDSEDPGEPLMEDYDVDLFAQKPLAGKLDTFLDFLFLQRGGKWVSTTRTN